MPPAGPNAGACTSTDASTDASTNGGAYAHADAGTVAKIDARVYASTDATTTYRCFNLLPQAGLAMTMVMTLAVLGAA